MEVGVGIHGHVVVDGQIDTLDVDTTTEDVCGDTDTLVEVLEFLVALNTVGAISKRVLEGSFNMVDLPFFLTDTGVHGNTGEIALAQQLVQLCGTRSTLDEDNDLIELEVVEQIVQLAVLLALAELHEILLQTVQSKLCLVVDVDLKRIPHEFLADGSDLFGESGTEHHDLLLGRGGAEDLLHVSAHVCF